MRKIAVLTALALLSLISIGLSQCVVPYEDISISNSTTFCAGTYYFNDTGGNGVVIITGDNLVLDCNNSVFIGNNTSVSKFIDAWDRVNITIKNCKFEGYNVGISLHNISDSVISNIEGQALSFVIEQSNKKGSNILFENIVCNGGGRCFFSDVGEKFTFRNVTAINMNEFGFALHGNFSDLFFDDINVTGGCSYNGISIEWGNHSNITIKDSYFSNLNKTAIVVSDVYGFTIINVEVSVAGEHGIETDNCVDCSIESSRFYNIGGFGLSLRNSSNAYIYNIECRDAEDCVHIHIYSSRNITIDRVYSYDTRNHGILAEYANDLRIKNSEIHDSDSMGIAVKWLRNAILENISLSNIVNTGIFIDDVNGSTFRDIEGYNSNCILGHQKGENNLFENIKCELSNRCFDGSLGNYLTFRNITVLNMSEFGFSFYGNFTNITIEDNYIENVEGQGIKIEGDSTRIEHVVIVNNTMINAKYGFIILKTNDIRIESNFIQSRAYSLIYNGVAKVVILNNTINRTEGLGATLYIYLDVENVTMRNNKLYHQVINYGLAMYPSACSYLDTYDIDTSNYFNGLPIYYLTHYTGTFTSPSKHVIIGNSEGFGVEGNFGTVQLVCSEGTMRNSKLSGNLYLDNSTLSMFSSEVTTPYEGLCGVGLIGFSYATAYDSSIHGDVRGLSLTSINMTLINSTFNNYTFYDTSSYITRKWYFDFSINMRARLKIKDRFGRTVHDKDVESGRLILTEYCKRCNQTGSSCVQEETIYYTPYTISFSKSGYYTESYTEDLTTNVVYSIILDPVAQAGGGVPAPPPPKPTVFCGDGICDPKYGENAISCPADCLPICGNGICEPGEDRFICPKDCKCNPNWVVVDNKTECVNATTVRITTTYEDKNRCGLNYRSKSILEYNCPEGYECSEGECVPVPVAPPKPIPTPRFVLPEEVKKALIALIISIVIGIVLFKVVV